MTLATCSRLLLIAILGGAVLFGCSAGAPEASAPEPQIDLAAEEEAVREVNRIWLENSHAKDAAGIAALFVEDGWQLTEERGLTDGRDALLAAFQSDFEENPDSVNDWGSKGVWVAASGDLAVERGWWTNDPDGEGEAEATEGEYVTVMVKVDGEWRILVDAGAPVGGVSTDD